MSHQKLGSTGRNIFYEIQFIYIFSYNKSIITLKYRPEQ